MSSKENSILDWNWQEEPKEPVTQGSVLDWNWQEEPIRNNQIIEPAVEPIRETTIRRQVIGPTIERERQLQQQRPTIIQGQPRERIRDTFLNRLARIALPRSLEVRLGVAEPTELEVMIQNEDARASLRRKREFEEVLNREIKEIPVIKEGYIEPESFVGQMGEGIISFTERSKGHLGYLLESFGRQIKSPELIERGSKIGDKATIEFLKRPELLPPDDLKPFFEGGILDKRWWGRRIGEAFPMLATSIGSSVLGGLTLGPKGAIGAPFLSSYTISKGSSYKRFIDEGISPNDASTYANIYASISALLENAMGVSPARIGKQLTTRGIERVAYNNVREALIKELPRIGARTLTNAISEGSEEVLQAITEDLIVRIFNKEEGIFNKDLLEEFASGFAVGIPFGVTNIRIPSIENRTITANQIIANRKQEQNIDNTINDISIKIKERPKSKTEANNVFPENQYKLDILEEIKTLPKLPIIERDAFGFIPPHIRKNSYSSFMYSAWDKISKIWDTKAPLVLKFAETKEISELIKERNKTYIGLKDKYIEDIIRPISKLSTEEKISIGEMIFKRINIPEDYQKTIKNIDSHIGQLGKSIIDISNELISSGHLANPAILKRSTEIGKKLSELNLSIRESLKNLDTTLKENNQTVSKINQAERNINKLQDEFFNELTMYFREGEEIDIDIPRKKRIVAIPEDLIPLSTELKKFKTFEEMIASPIGIKVERLARSGKLERSGFRSARYFFDSIKNSYQVTPAKKAKKIIKGKVNKITKALKGKERTELQLDILNNIDLLSNADSLVFLEQLISDLRDERGDLRSELSKIREELKKGLPLFSEEIWMENLGEYARTIYIKVDEKTQNFSMNFQSAVNKDGLIDRSAFKRKLTDEEWGANALLREGKTEKEISMYSLENLKDIGVAAKEKYGWTFQADYILAKTFDNLSRVRSAMLFQNEIVNNHRLFSRKKREGFVPVSDFLPKNVKKDARFGPLNDGYIHPGLVDELKIILDQKKYDVISRAFQMPLSWWKIFRVAANPATIIRNFISGAFIQTDMAGYPVWNPKNSPKYIEALLSYFQKNDTYKKYRDNGMYGLDFHSIEIEADEMSRIIRKMEASANPMETFSDSLIEKIGDIEKDARKVFNYYAQIDHIQRTYLAICAQKDGATVSEAINFANKWQLDYRYVPKIIEYMRSGLPGWIFPFISFHTLMAPRVLEVLVTRPWTLLKYPIIISAMTAISMATLDIDEEEVKSAMPKHLTDKDYVSLLPNRDKNGNLMFLDLSFTFPFGGIDTGFLDLNAILNMLRSPGLISGITGMLNNYDNFSQRKIYNETDTSDVKKDKIIEYIARNFGPGFIPHAKNIWEAYTGEPTGFPVKQERDLFISTARALGVSIHSGGFNDAYWKIKTLEDEIKDIRLGLKKILENPNISIEEKREKEKDFDDAIIYRSNKIQNILDNMPQAIIKEEESNNKLLEW